MPKLVINKSTEPKMFRAAIDSNPINIKNDKKTPIIKDTIWLDEMAEENKPMLTKPVDKKSRPKYEPQIAPVSTFPIGIAKSLIEV